MTTDALDQHVAKHGTGEDLRALVLTELAGIRNDLAFVRTYLIDTRQAPTLPFLSVEAAKVQDDLARAERKDRYRNAIEGVKLSGATPVPGSVAALSLLAEWDTLLTDVERSTTTRLLRARVCLISSRPADDVDRYDRVVELVGVLNRDAYLRRIHSDLVELHAKVTRCIEGTQIKAMPDPCPWCGHQSLVANLTTGVITCDRDPHTGEHEPCVCSDSYCLCKTKPRTHRHTWQRADQAHKGSSWEGLRRAINARITDPTD